MRGGEGKHGLLGEGTNSWRSPSGSPWRFMTIDNDQLSYNIGHWSGKELVEVGVASRKDGWWHWWGRQINVPGWGMLSMEQTFMVKQNSA